STSTSWVSELTLRRATGDSVSGTSGSVSDRAVVWVLSAGCWLVSVATDHSVFSGWWLPASTQSPRWLIPTGMGVYWPVSSALSTPTAVTMDTGCSGDWPPNNTRPVLVIVVPPVSGRGQAAAKRCHGFLWCRPQWR